MSHSTIFTGKLCARMSDDLHLGGMSEPAHDGYLGAVRKLATMNLQNATVMHRA